MFSHTVFRVSAEFFSSKVIAASRRSTLWNQTLYPLRWECVTQPFTLLPGSQAVIQPCWPFRGYIISLCLPPIQLDSCLVVDSWQLACDVQPFSLLVVIKATIQPCWPFRGYILCACGERDCLCPHMVRRTSITDVVLRRSSRIKPTPVVFDNKIPPALLAIIKFTHLMNLPHDFPIYIFPCFEI